MFRTASMTADDLLAEARKGRPNVAYTKNIAGNGIAAWYDGRWICVAAYTLMKCWVSVEHEIEINGHPAWPQDEWVPVEMTDEQRNHGPEAA